MSAYRLNTIHRVLFRTKDSTYDDTSVWSALELCVSVICCAIPALRPLFSKLLPRVFGTTALSNRKPSDLGAGYVSGSSRSSRGARKLARGMSGGDGHGGTSYDLESLGGLGAGSKV